MAPQCLPAGCYTRVTNTWELTNNWTGRSAIVHSRLQPPQWSQKDWDGAMLHTGVPKFALDELHRLTRPERRGLCCKDKNRSPSRGRDRAPAESGGHRRVVRIQEGDYNDHVPTKKDFAFKRIEKKPSEKELKSILKHKDDRLFFDDVKGPYYEFNTSSDNPIMYARHKYPTAEHLLLQFKFAEWPEICDYLRRQPTITKLWEAAERFSDKKSANWKHDKHYFMEIVLWRKFTQDKRLKKLLLDTGERPITYVSSVDSFWGAGRDGHGKNYLGKALEKIRWRIKTCTPPV